MPREIYPIDSVNPNELSQAKEHINGVTAEVSDKEIEQYLSGELFEAEEYDDGRVPLVKRVRALLQFWHELSTSLAKAQEGYGLAKKWDDEQLKKKFLEEGGPLVKKMKILESELKGVLPSLAKVQFLRDDEMRLLPKWMLKLLEVQIIK